MGARLLCAARYSAFGLRNCVQFRFSRGFRYQEIMGKPISETKKADLLRRAESRLNFASNLPVSDVNREAKINAAEKAMKTALASKTGNVRRANKPVR
jgi:hypothetical protein